MWIKSAATVLAASRDGDISCAYVAAVRLGAGSADATTVARLAAGWLRGLCTRLIASRVGAHDGLEAACMRASEQAATRTVPA